jgi:N-methyl-L-tryptophan oxidase
VADRVYDAIVVGAGTMGSQAGLFLAGYGLSVLLFDSAEPPHTQGSHHGQTRLYRQAYAGPGSGTHYIPLSLQALDRWLSLERQSGRQLFHRLGVINIAPEDSAAHTAKTDNARLYGLNVEELGPKSIERRWPGLRVPRGSIGLWERDAGILDAERSVQTALSAAKAAGANFVEAAVTAIKAPAVHTSRGVFYGHRILLTANASVPSLLAGHGLTLPVTAQAQTVEWFKGTGDHEAGKLPGFTFETKEGQFYGFPSFGSGVKLGRHDRAATDGELGAFASRSLPGTGSKLKSVECVYDVSADEDFIIDQVPGAPVWYATGFSGHGFKFAPAVGNLLARWLVSGERPPLLEPFSPSRFH